MRQSKLINAIGLALGLTVGTAHAGDNFQFDPDGAGPDSTRSVSIFDWLPSTALAKGAVPDASAFTLYTHAKMGQMVLDGVNVAGTGLNSSYEITAVSGFGETGIVTGINSTSFFDDQGNPTNFFRIYWDPSQDSDELGGTGFENGTLILSGHIIDSTGSYVLTLDPATLTPVPPEALDQKDTNDYPGILTLVGTGGTTIDVQIDYANPDFFPGDQPAQLVLQTQQNTPFNQVDPSAQLTDMTGAPVIPAVGDINAADGPDLLLQADASSTVILAPPIAALGDFVWEDLNGDGLQSAGEAGIVGVEAQLLSPGGDGLCGTGDEVFITNQFTAADGSYLFANLDPSIDYCVGFVKPAGFDCTIPNVGADNTIDSDGLDQGDGTCQTDDNIENPIDLANGETDRTWDLGLYRPAELGDYVWNDINRDGIQNAGEPGIPGVEARLSLCDGGVIIGAAIAIATTDANGLYLFSNLSPGEYAVSFVAPAGYEYSPANIGNDALDSDAENIVGNLGETACVTLESGESDLTVDAGLYQMAGLGDRVWEDLNANGIQDSGEPGIPGVTVNLLEPGNDGNCNTGDENIIDTVVTDGTGIYQFEDLVPARYCVEFIKPEICDAVVGGGSTFSPANQGGDDAKDSDADMATGQTGNIDLGGNEFDPTNDAGVYCPAKIGDYVWNDTNENGLQEGGESGIGNITVNLYDCGPDGVLGTADDGGSDTTTTAADGMYMFSPLMPGNYAIEFVSPAGYVFTPQDQGADDSIDSDADTTTGKTVCTNLESNEYDDTVDAGLYVPQRPAIDIEKATNGIDADDPNAGDAPQVAPGDAVTWTYRVTNTGNVALNNVAVVDDQGVAVSCPSDFLAVGDYMDCTASGFAEDLTSTGYTVVPGMCGSTSNSPLYENKGTATGTTAAGAFVQDDDFSHYCNPPGGGGQGCTPGFWKQEQHFNAWYNPPYAPDTLFSAVFEDAFPGKTLLGVLDQGGGGLNALGRHTVAALLNSATADVNYDVGSPAGVISAFNGVFPGTKDEYTELKNQFEGFNEQGCPIDGKEAPSNLP